MTTEPLRLGTPAARGVLFATVLGSGIAFLDGTIVNTALPVMDRQLGLGVSGLQWVVSGYLVVLSALLLLGGSLGDLYGRRRVYAVGLGVFAAASGVIAVAPTNEIVIAARLVQGVGAALLIPVSLAIIQTMFAAEDRSAAIGRWTGASSGVIALAPFVGGGLVTYASWRWAFAINLPLCAIVLWATFKWVPETTRAAADAGKRPDFLGSALVALALAGLTYWSIEAGGLLPTLVGIGGLVVLVLFLVVESRVAHPLLPLALFRSAQFDWVNLCTVLIYGAFGTALTFLGVQLQVGLGYDPLLAGLATLPASGFMVLLAGRFGALAHRIGPRWPMAAGSTLIAAGLALLSMVHPGDSYWIGVLPGVLVWGFGLSMTVAPLTSAALSAVDDAHTGVASAFNNAMSRIGSALGVALVPVAVGLGGATSLGGPAFAAHYSAAVLLAAGGAVVAAIVAATGVR